MFDSYDPRSDDPRDRERHDGWRPGRSRPGMNNGGSGRPVDVGFDLRRPIDRDRDHDARELDRGRDDRERGPDPRDVFARHLDLPQGRDREVVHDPRGRKYTLRGSEARTLATVGAFRVVPAGDLRDRPADPREGDLRHLREQGLVQTVRLPGRRDVLVVLTDLGRDLLEGHRARDEEPLQAFYAGLRRPREAEHDSQLFAAYLREAERLAERDAQVERVLLDYEIKRDYQRWLQARNRDRSDADGRPDREPGEIADWARDHDLPYFDGKVHFPDVRVEYLTFDGRHDHDDIELVTEHYRGAHGGAVGQSGFTSVRGFSARVGRGGRGGGGRRRGPAEELLR